MPRTTFHEKLRHEGWALLPIRLIVGFGFAAHGYAKLSRGPEVFATILHSMGVPHPSVVAWITALLEFFGGICVMAGAFVVPLSLPLIAIMLTAMVSVHLRYGFSSIRLLALDHEGATFGPIGYEINLLYVAGLIALVLGGSGMLSVDRYLSQRYARKHELVSHRIFLGLNSDRVNR